MRIDINELKRAITWIESNSRDLRVSIYTGDSNKMVLSCVDKLDNEIEITLFTDGQMLPKIKKTEILR